SVTSNSSTPKIKCSAVVIHEQESCGSSHRADFGAIGVCASCVTASRTHLHFCEPGCANVLAAQYCRFSESGSQHSAANNSIGASTTANTDQLPRKSFTAFAR